MATTTTTPSSTIQIPTTQTTPLPSSTTSATNFDSSSTSTSPSTSPSSNNNNGDNSTFTNSANYFFGFLITFVVLLAIFLTCGCISRRRIMARRRNGLPPSPTLWGMRMERGPPPVEPSWVEPWLDPKTETKWTSWRSIVPLSAAIISDRPTKDEGYEIPAPAPTPPSPVPPHYVSLLSISSYIPRFRRRRSDQDRNRAAGKAAADQEQAAGAKKELGPPTMAQVATMIAMPCNARHGECPTSRQVYEFGLTHVPYNPGTIPATTTATHASTSGITSSAPS